MLDLKDHGRENDRGSRYVSVVNDFFNKFDCTVAIRNKNAITITDSLEINLITSKRKPNLIETDVAREVVNKIFTDLLKKNNNKRYSRYTSLGAVFAECFNRTNRDLLERAVFQSRDGN